MEKSPVNTTLGTRIAHRREELGISQAAAARIAGVQRSTWAAWEKDENAPSDSKHAAIERACQWEPGSVRAIRDGGEPTPLAEDPGGAGPNPGAQEDAFIRELQAMNLAPKKFDAIVGAYRADVAREAAQRRRDDAALEEKYRTIARAI